MTNAWNIHNCAHDSVCRTIESNPPNRLYLNTPLGSLMIALDSDSWTQLWLPLIGYTNHWWPVAWHPRARS